MGSRPIGRLFESLGRRILGKQLQEYAGVHRLDQMSVEASRAGLVAVLLLFPSWSATSTAVDYYSLAGVLRGSRCGLRSRPSLGGLRPGGAGVRRSVDDGLSLDRLAMDRVLPAA
jgi:hypothetical protein